MRLEYVLGAGTIIHPEHGSRVRIELIDKDAHKGPDAGGKINTTIPHDRPTAGWPGRDHPAIANDFLRPMRSAEFPLQLPRFRVEAVQLPIVTATQHTTFPGHRRHSHWRVCVKRPHGCARLQVVRHHLVAIIEAHEHARTQDNRFEARS